MNTVGSDQSTPLYHAVQNRDRSIVCLLLDIRELDLNISDSLMWTPLSWAVDKGDLAMV
ncbi:uncharacterized protein BDW43DRAFT_261183 [Aspergillus alliaceus]|uniref:uncharacterized protein n=1 Tax=Petromyces alliaceus TaxID=209559 RepID=UPI0012A76C1B|nr:uncharacterized protein BDW43DRAFT_261183 [Aspergillus alliaceus]KAB8239274.1 hypothetical protein BDW43DRAFT_261183 [Aspergillus alliaceus]